LAIIAFWDFGAKAQFDCYQSVPTISWESYKNKTMTPLFLSVRSLIPQLEKAEATVKDSSVSFFPYPLQISWQSRLRTVKSKLNGKFNG